MKESKQPPKKGVVLPEEKPQEPQDTDSLENLCLDLNTQPVSKTPPGEKLLSGRDSKKEDAQKEEEEEVKLFSLPPGQRGKLFYCIMASCICVEHIASLGAKRSVCN